MRKVKAEAVLIHKLASLLYMSAKHLAQGCLQKVGRGMVLHDAFAALPVN